MATAAFGWIGAEVVAAMIGAPAVLVSPDALQTALRSAPQVGAPTLGAIAVVAGLLGLLLLRLALMPGRLPRRALRSGQALIVADDRVLAAFGAHVAARAGGLSPESAKVQLKGRKLRVTLIPSTGCRVDAGAVARKLEESIESALGEPLTVEVGVSRSGVVGA
jgi:hypothetical protein